MRNRFKGLGSFFFVFACIGMVSCTVDSESDGEFDYYAQYQIDSVIVEDYIQDNNIEAYSIGSSGVFISIFHEGIEDTLLHPTRDTIGSATSQYVTVGYKGYLTDGSVFDQTAVDVTSTFALDNVIYGWQIAIPEMSKGDSATLLIPSYWGYGNQAIGSIPANSVLIFDVYLDSFERK